MKNIEIPWCFKYVGLPLSIVAVLYKVSQKISQRKRKSNLRGKVVVVTGASSGIGEALAHAFYDQGSKVVLAARREHELNRVKDELLSKKLSVPSPEPVVLKLDLADLDSLELFIQRVYDICGDIDVLINNGGVSHRGAILNTKTEVDKKIMYIDYFGPVYLTKAALPKMVKLRKGHIVFISSIQGRVALPDRSAYAAAKHAMQAFGDSLRAEMDQHNINVTVVSPGYVKTAVSVNALSGSGDNHGVMDKSTAAGFTPEYTAEKILDSIANKEDELLITQFIGKFAIFMRYFSPAFYFYIMAKRANKTSLE